MKQFYPLLEAFLKEAAKRVTDDQIAATKLEDLAEVINPKTQKKIDMKHLKFEMESAKNAIVAQAPLFANVVHEFDPVIYTWHVDTMGTDGIRLFVNPEFADSLTWEQKIFVILHEIMHCILIHQERGEGFDHDKFNIAGDYEINILLSDTFIDDKGKEMFPIAFIEAMKGLIDQKYLNMAAEQIYRELPDGQPQKDNKGKSEKEGGKGQQIVIEPGMKVRIKATGKIGIVTKVKSGGTYLIDEIAEDMPQTENLFFPRLNLLNEAGTPPATVGNPNIYSRDEFIPILPAGGGGGGGGQPSDEEVEIEGEGEGSGKEGEGKGKGAGKEMKAGQKPGQGGGGGEQSGDPSDKKGYGDMVEAPAVTDPGACGAILSKAQGDKLARQCGYSDEESNAGKMPDWRHNGRKLLKDAEKMGEKAANKGRGIGGGNVLLKVLGRLYKTDIHWKQTLRRYVAAALSPEMETRMPNKRHMNANPQFPWRTVQKNKMDAIEKAFICVDVSGSMSSKTLSRIANEICGLVRSQKVNEIIVISFDGQVQHVQSIKYNQAVELLVTQGGTEFQAPLDYIHENYRDNVSVCVMFSDGDCPPPKKPKYWKKFIWVIYDSPNWTQPWGRLIKAMSADM